jgi:hypothetical protein
MKRGFGDFRNIGQPGKCLMCKLADLSSVSNNHIKRHMWACAYRLRPRKVESDKFQSLLVKHPKLTGKEKLLSQKHKVDYS